MFNFIIILPSPITIITSLVIDKLYLILVKANKNVRMKQVLTILFLFHFTFSFSQQKLIDSFLNEYNKSTVDTAKIDLILKVSEPLSDMSPQKAIFYGKAALKIAQTINDTHRESLLYNMIGQGYDQIGNMADAISNFNEGFKVATQCNNLADLAQLKLNLGVSYANIGNEKLAIEYYKSAEHYFQLLNDSIGLCKSDVDLSDAFYQLNNPDSSLYYIEKGMGISVKIKNYWLGYLYDNAAEAYFRKKDFGLAKDYANKSIAVAEKLSDLYILADDYLVLAKANLAIGDVANAALYANKGLSTAKQTNIKENLIDAYNIISQVFENQHKYEEALKYKTLYITVKDSVQSAINNNILQAYEYEKRDEEMAMIKADKLQKDAELKKQHAISVVILGTLLLVICISGYIFYSRNKLRNANRAIEKAYEEVNTKQQEIIKQNRELIWNNEQIKSQANHIEQLSNVKDRLFTIISHDLRAPLTTLKGILNLLAAGTITIEKFKTIVPNLLNSVSTTSELVDNLLQWSKSQLTGATIYSSNFDINELAQTQLSLFERQTLDKKLELTNEIPSKTFVYADKNMIDLVLRNLVGNSIKFCNANGKITVTSKQFEDYIEVSVADNGIGIAPENIDKVFQSKERYTTIGTNKEMGTGLGLLLCKDFVEKNNGTIGVESKVNKGSRFWFTLPKRTEV